MPPDSTIVQTALQIAHTAAREGTQKTLHHLRASFSVDHDRRLVADFVRTCMTCQRNKTEALQPAGLLQPLPVPSRVWADISMDFVEALPKVHGKTVVLTEVRPFHTIEPPLHGCLCRPGILPGDCQASWIAGVDSLGSRSSVYRTCMA